MFEPVRMKFLSKFEKRNMPTWVLSGNENSYQLLSKIFKYTNDTIIFGTYGRKFLVNSKNGDANLGLCLVMKIRSNY